MMAFDLIIEFYTLFLAEILLHLDLLELLINFNHNFNRGFTFFFCSFLTFDGIRKRSLFRVYEDSNIKRWKA